MRIALLVPTYNEVNNVDKLIRSVRAVSRQHREIFLTLFIVDDSSPDGTADVVRELSRELSGGMFQIRLMVREEKKGLGAAYIDAFTRVLAEDAFDYFIQMDADLSHDPKYLSGFFYQASMSTEFVVASRYVPGGGTPDWSVRRKFLSRGGNTYARMVLGRRLTDYTGGFNMYSKRLLSAVQVQSISASGYGFLLSLKYRALKNAVSFVELPIVFSDRTQGVSKIPRSTLWTNFVLVPAIKFAGVRGRPEAAGRRIEAVKPSLPIALQSADPETESMSASAVTTVNDLIALNGFPHSNPERGIGR